MFICILTFQHPLLSQQPFIIHDMETFQLAEKTLAAHMVNGDNPEPESGLQAGELVPAVGCGELQQREAEARLFHCCQSTSVETVTELTEFAKAVPGFQSLDLNDQVGLRDATWKIVLKGEVHLKNLNAFIIYSASCRWKVW